ncbi:MAG: hypothetical protein J6Z03_01765, partial [Erysipelotrichaceae bacterium]|nr:hypothetical protein [Erysipelotrichaceae bacterium]
MKNILFNILKVLLLLLALLFLELNKNTLLGWFLTALIIFIYVLMTRIYKVNGFLTLLLCLALFVITVFVSWPPY